MTEQIEVATPRGPGRLTVTRPARPVGVLALGHGAGGLGWSADIVAVAAAAADLNWATVLVDQPWRLAGRRVASPPATLDEAWVPLVRAALALPGMPSRLVVGGRSAGARVACRTAVLLDARGVLALSFPLHPPGRPGSSRAAELALPVTAGIPTHVVQGERDPFGAPEEVEGAVPGVPVAAVPGTHSFRSGADVAAAAATWLDGLG